MDTSGTHKIRPAGRHILTIGRDLIQNRYAAIVELVKNAYDADSPDVNIEFRATAENNFYTICVEDHGHGMSRDTVINKWLVPSTDDKLKRRTSPLGRTMQGRKGVGRYAASVLGNDLLLETVTPSGEKTTVYIEWKNFESAQYLDDVDVLVESEETVQSSGTRLTITGDKELISEWEQPQFDKLKFELKKLMSPVSIPLSGNKSDDQFQINLISAGFVANQEGTIRETIEPFPIFDLFDYKIAGRIGADGKGLLTYSVQKARNTPEEKIKFNIDSPTGCGELFFDVRVYDRESEAIELLIGRGLRDESGNYVGKLEARQLLNRFQGIGVYRNGFRIRPLGDPDFDWLELNSQRVQNPSRKIGVNQVIGYVQIQAEEQSGLIEKSARDGLRENAAFENLNKITKMVIAELETKRFNYRMKAGLSRPALKLEKELDKLFAFDEMKRGVEEQLTKSHVNKKAAAEIIEIISREASEKSRLAEDVRKTVAIYQGQATLGKIINVVLHEGRRPLNYFKNEIPHLDYYFEKYLEFKDADALSKFLEIAKEFGFNADVLVKLFDRLDPLAARERSARILLPLKKIIEGSLTIFHDALNKHRVSVKIRGSDDFSLLCWRQDIYEIFTNLVDNSIYWMSEKNSQKREIEVIIETDKGLLQYIDYRDTGPGIEPNLIDSSVIFEPQFSTKPDGTGLGLAIAGEAASRNGLELKAYESNSGAYFRLQPKTE